MARIDIEVTIKTKDLYFCPLCEDGAHGHVFVVWTENGKPFMDEWISAEGQPVAESCIDWCRERGTPVTQGAEAEPWAADDETWRGS